MARWLDGLMARKYSERPANRPAIKQFNPTNHLPLATCYSNNVLTINSVNATGKNNNKGL